MKEFVFLGHPDKQADLVADLLVEKALKADPLARCAIEVMLKGFGDGVHVFVAGETSHAFNLQDVRDAVYEAHRLGTLDRVPAPFMTVAWALTPQSPHIASNMGKGVGDQCIVVGAAFSRNHLCVLNQRFFKGVFNFLSGVKAWTGDGKMLVSADTSTITFSLSGDIPDGEYEFIEDMLAHKADILFGPGDRTIVVNPPGRSSWHGGPLFDCGVTGRKLACDSHGVFAPHGGGATSGKDMSKPDRGMKLVANEIAKRALKQLESDHFSSDEVIVTLGYQMGDNRPLSVQVRSSLPGATQAVESIIATEYDEIVKSVLSESFSVDVCHPWIKSARILMGTIEESQS